MTTVYFVRHAESDNSVRDGRIRPLTEKGWRDRAVVTDYLADKRIQAIFSSPFKRAVDTVSDFAQKYGHEIEIVEDFRERKSDSDWGRERDYWPLIEKQWADFNYTLSNGETLGQVQERNIAALNDVLQRRKDQTLAIGTHGTALLTIMNYYDGAYGFSDFKAMAAIMPWVVKMTFEGTECRSIEKIDILALSAQKEN